MNVIACRGCIKIGAEQSERRPSLLRQFGRAHPEPRRFNCLAATEIDAPGIEPDAASSRHPHSHNHRGFD